jgi:hypothetical protein
VAAQGDVTKLKPEAFQKWGQSEVVLTGKLTKVIPGPVGLSDPPLYSHRLEFQIDKVLRGSLKKGDMVMASHSIRQKERPTFPEGKECLVSLSFVRNFWVIRSVQELKPEELAQAEMACAVPLGWTMEKGQLVSPWAKLGKSAWPADSKLTSAVICSVTGRPGWLAGSGVAFSVEPVPPKVPIQFRNPDGDGEYKITLKNTTDKPVTVPALLTDGKTVFWDDCLVILCQNKVYPIPGVKGLKGELKPVELKPGESISTVVNALRLEGPEWPRGGYRIEFSFCLGEKSGTQSFYYFSRHHDPIREKLLKKE